MDEGFERCMQALVQHKLQHQVEQLVALGFAPSAALAAVQQHGGNLEGALVTLLEQVREPEGLLFLQAVARQPISATCQDSKGTAAAAHCAALPSTAIPACCCNPCRRLACRTQCMAWAWARVLPQLRWI